MSFFSNISSSLSTGSSWFFVLVFLALGFGYGMVMGKNRMMLVAVAGYFSLVVSKAIPWEVFSKTEDVPSANVQIFLFLAIILAIFFLAPHSGFSSVIRISGRGRANWWQLLIFGTVELGFLISIVVSFLPQKTLVDLSPIILDFFAKQPAQFLWLVLPLIAMFVLKKKRSYRAGGEE